MSNTPRASARPGEKPFLRLQWAIASSRRTVVRRPWQSSSSRTGTRGPSWLIWLIPSCAKGACARIL
eukprot:6263931-Alexandrium_andersonii.AAC.1